MAFDPISAGASVLGSVVGGVGSHAAAQAQESAAWQQQQAARRNMLMQLGIYEPARSTGYQALSDVNNFFGYSTPQYQSANTLATSQTPLSGKQVKKFVKQGLSVDQISGMGSLNAGSKTISRLIKAGLTPEQITRLQNGPAANASNPAPGSAPGGAGAGAAPGGGENWNALYNSPDYQFVRSEGERNMGNSFAARGGAASGNALRALEQFRQGLASQQIDKYLGRRMGMIGLGTQANNSISDAGNTNSLWNQRALGAMGDARASGIMGITNSIQGGLSDFSTIGGQGGLGNWSAGNSLQPVDVYSRRMTAPFNPNYSLTG